MKTSQLLKNLIRDLSSSHPVKEIRVLGCIEGVLITSGKLNPNVGFTFKEILVENPSIFAPWFPGTAPSIKRRETYEEMIVRSAKEHIDTLQEKDL